MLRNRVKFYFAGWFLEFVDARLADRPYEWLLHQIAELTELQEVAVLEVGAGTGFASRAIERKLPEALIAAVDLSPELLGHGRRVASQVGSTIRFIRADGCSLPFADGSLELVVSAFFLHELSSAKRSTAVGEIRRILKPGGLLLVADLDEAVRLRRLFRFYLLLSHGAGAKAVLGHGLVDLLTSHGFEIESRGGGRGKLLPHQVVRARM